MQLPVIVLLAVLAAPGAGEARPAGGGTGERAAPEGRAVEEFAGLGWTLEYPAERWAPRESSIGGRYILEFVDREEPGALHPPLRIETCISERPYRKFDVWARAAAEQFRDALEARGLEPGELDRTLESIGGELDITYVLTCTSEDGRAWTYSFFERHLSYPHAAVYSRAVPEDDATRRERDLDHAFRSLEFHDFDLWDEIRYSPFGLPVSVPASWDSALVADASQAYLEARFGDAAELEVRVFRLADAAQAVAAADQFRASLPEQIPAAVTAAGKTYDAEESHPARYLIGERTVLGWRTGLHGHEGEWGGYRYDAVFPLLDFVVGVTTVARWSSPERGLDAMHEHLGGMAHGALRGHTVTTIRDGLVIRHDSGLRLQRTATPGRVRYDLLRLGVNDPESDPDPEVDAGELWLELRGDLGPGSNLDDVYPRFYRTRYREDPTREGGKQARLLGDTYNGREAWFRMPDEEPSHVLTAFITLWDADTHLLVGSRGNRTLMPELVGLHAHLMHGLERATPGTLVTYEDPGVTYAVDPGLWAVEGGLDGRTSTATLRNTTLSTAWAPLGAGFLGPPPSAAEALRQRVADASLGWSFDGDVGEPVFGEAAFGPEASVPAHFASLRRTDADGAAWDETWMVGDVDGRRCWARVTSEVGDAEAADAVSAVLATVLPR